MCSCVHPLLLSCNPGPTVKVSSASARLAEINKQMTELKNKQSEYFVHNTWYVFLPKILPDFAKPNPLFFRIFKNSVFKAILCLSKVTLVRTHFCDGKTGI